MKEKEISAHPVADLLSISAETVRELSAAGPLLGEGIEENGVHVFPVSRLSVGLAGGGADIVKGRKQSAPAGTGAKVSLDPVAVLVVGQDGEVSVRTIPKQEAPSHATETVEAVGDQIRRFLDDRAAKKGSGKSKEE